MPKGYMTVKEACAHSGLSEGQLRHLLRLGNLKGERVGRTWLVSIRSLDIYIKNPPKPGPKRQTT